MQRSQGSILLHRTRKEGHACENMEEPARKKSTVIEDTRIEELDSDFGLVVEILYDPGWFLIPLKQKKKGTWSYPKWQTLSLYMRFREEL